MKKISYAYKKKQDREKRFFLDGDLITDLDTVNQLYSFVQYAQSLYEDPMSPGAFWNKKQIISLYKNIYTFGMYDKILQKLNGLYSELGRDDLFTIDKEFLDNYYESLSDRREIAAAGMELGNRLSKIPGQLITRNIIQRDENGNTIKDNTRHWSKFYVYRLGELYNEYIENSEQWLFMENVNLSKNITRPSFFYVETDNRQEYSRFIQWFKSQTSSLNEHKSFYCMLRDFYMYSKLKYCESYFYQMKNENMAELISMQERGEIGVKITDSTRFDKKYIKSEEERQNTVLLSTELPGYSKQYILHFKLDKLNRILGRPESQPLSIEQTIERHMGHTYFSHKLTDEQIEYIKTLEVQKLDVLPVTKDIIQCMKSSIRKKQEYDREKARIDRMKSEQGDSQMKRKEEDKGKKDRGKKNSLMEDIPFTEELCENIESSLGVHIPEEYKYSSESKSCLMYKSEKQKMKFSAMYKYMRNFLQTKLSGEGQELSEKVLTDETNKMYVYIKLCGKGFWNLTYNDKRPIILEEAYKEYDSKFSTISTAIQEGIPIDRLRDYVKSHTSPNIKDGVSKNSKDFKGKRRTAKKLSNQMRKKEQAFSSVEDSENDKKSTDNTDKKSKEELIKQALIESIESKKKQLELKRNELALLEEEVERLENLKESIEKNSIGDDD